VARFTADCSYCTIVIIGDEEEVLQAASDHAVSMHGLADNPELREQIRAALEPDSRKTVTMYWY
jgi:hypothetical protein